jgi:DNA-binding transcriptional regulator YiaG
MISLGMFNSKDYIEEKKIFSIERIIKTLNEDTPFMELIQLIMEYFGLSQAELSRFLQVSPATISAWKTGKTEPSIWTQDSVKERLWVLVQKHRCGRPTTIFKKCK